MNLKPTSMLRRHRRSRRAAFTLVEMLLVLVILAILAAIVIPKFAGRSQQAKETAAKSQISSIELALDAYEVDTGGYPAGNTIIVPGAILGVAVFLPSAWASLREIAAHSRAAPWRTPIRSPPRSR